MQTQLRKISCTHIRVENLRIEKDHTGFLCHIRFGVFSTREQLYSFYEIHHD